MAVYIKQQHAKPSVRLRRIERRAGSAFVWVLFGLVGVFSAQRETGWHGLRGLRAHGALLASALGTSAPVASPGGVLGGPEMSR
jgi:hypothetical protein